MARTMVLKLFVFVFLLLRENYTLKCGVGQYLKDLACRGCKNTCARCISEFHCTGCKAGFFGPACSKNCSERCLEKLCVQQTGICLFCKREYYLTATCEPCPDNCTECVNAAICSICKTGYTGSICQKRCVNCKPNSGCSLLEGICNDGCKDGYSGRTCLKHCSSNCLSCDRLDANKCTSCVDGKYGNNCEKSCPTKCTDNICSKDTGTCTHGCQNGFWGNQCEYVCPVNCRGGACSRSSGVCFDGCSGNFTGTKCLCPRTCDCDQDGTCIKCYGSTGFVCDKQCSSICINNICSLNMERKCLYGCRDGYDGSSCSPLTDDESGLRAERISLVVLSALLFIMTGTVIYLLYQRRKSIGARRMNGNQQTEMRPIGELSEAYVQSSEQYSVTSPLSAVSESYNNPVYIGVNS